MTDHEIVEWLFMLGSTNVKRRSVVLDLAKCPMCQVADTSESTCQHRYGELSPEDLVICNRGLALIDAGAIPEVAGPKHIEMEADFDD